MTGDERGQGAPTEREEAVPGEPLVSVREVPDEQTATLLRDFLSDQGIAATAVAVQIPWLGTVATLLHGYWGRIEVLGKDAARARALLDDFFAATPEQTPWEVGGEEES